MAFPFQLPSALLTLSVLHLFSRVVSAQDATSTAGSNSTAEEALPTFGDTVTILGAMDRTNQDFQDGLAIDFFSPKNRTLIVTKNASPLGADFVTGASGSPFVALQNYSYILTMNETAQDLIAKIEIPYSLKVLQIMAVQEANTYVATLAADKKSWAVNDATRNVHRSENNTRIIKMTSLDGEYMLVGRQTEDTANIFVQYGQGTTRTVNITGGPGVQQNEFVDGMRFSVQSEKALLMNVDLMEGVNPGTLPSGTKSLNSFAWIVTSAPFEAVSAETRVPFNRAMLSALVPTGSSPSTMLTVAKRALNATSGQFLLVMPDAQVVRELPEDRIQTPGMTQLDGQYIILVTSPKAVGQTPAAMGVS